MTVTVIRRSVLGGLVTAPALAAQPVSASTCQVLTAADIVRRAHSAAGGETWMRPRTLTLSGHAIFFPEGSVSPNLGAR